MKVFLDARACHEMCLLPSSCPSICVSLHLSMFPHVISVAPTGQIYVKFDIGNFMQICQDIQNLVKTEQKCPALYMKT
jgi:hypothetical protein